MKFKDENREPTLNAIAELEKLQADGFNWVARDEDSSLFAHNSFPFKRTIGFREGHGEWYGRADSSRFCSVADGHSPAYTDVLWEDEESTDIRDLLTSLRREVGEDPVPDDSPDDTYVERDYRPDVRFPTFGESDNGMPHTPHYMNGLIETIDVIKMALTPEEFKGFLKGNVLKYELRAPYKHETPDEDYQKAKDYFNLLEEENQ